MPGESRKFPWINLARVASVPIHCPLYNTPNRMDYARYFEVTPQTIDRWVRNGIPWYTADHIAVKNVGVHPGSIWPTWFDEEEAAA